MKSYTDTEQSKKLAEILPLDSADMHYHYDYDFGELESIPTITEEGDHFNLFPEDVRCWSLAALLNILPVSCDDGQHCLALINHNPNEKTEWLCAYEDDKGNLMMECYADNQIDACVAMIDKLHEQNLL